MNILFVLYHDLSCNSASHVDGVARPLGDRDCDCFIAVPTVPSRAERFVPYPYQVAHFAELLERPACFRDGRGPDIVHSWNPREVTRRFCAQLAQRCTFRTVVHLEDNEDHISRCMLGANDHALAAAGLYPGEFPAHLSHPLHSKDFMDRADGFSLLIESLAQMKSATKPHVVFWPAVDSGIFHDRPRNDILRRELGISPDTCVLVYHGNVHAANFHEVRSLYLAVALLNRTGVPARLLRLGNEHVPVTDDYKRWAAEFTIALGFESNRHRIADVLATADVFVQPGRTDPFNDYRFPSKLPEFFALGRPVVLPRANVGTVARHLVDAYVLEDANGASIRDAVAHLWSEPNLRHKLANGARAFAATRFSWDAAATRLLSLYRWLEVTPAARANVGDGIFRVAA